jgi:predicted small metal-binding protein
MGMTCSFEIKDAPEAELMKMVAIHAESSHSVKQIPADMMKKLKEVIKK